MSRSKKYGSHAEKLLLISPDLFESMLAKIQTASKGLIENNTHQPDTDINSTIANNSSEQMNTALDSSIRKTPANRVSEYNSALHEFKSNYPEFNIQAKARAEDQEVEASPVTTNEPHSQLAEVEIPSAIKPIATDINVFDAVGGPDKVFGATGPHHSSSNLHTKHNIQAGLTENQNNLAKTVLETIESNKEAISLDDQGNVYIDSKPLKGHIKDFIDGIVTDRKSHIHQNSSSLAFIKRLLQLGLPKKAVKNKELNDLLKFDEYINVPIKGWSQA